MDKYISLNAALEAISEECKVCGPSGNCPFIMNCWIKQHRKALLNVPAADVRPVKVGHWIRHISDLFPADSTIECDQCHAEQPIWIDDNFCPNCGADMREEQHG